MPKKSRKPAKHSQKPLQIQLPGRGVTTRPLAEVLHLLEACAARRQWPQVVELARQILAQVPVQAQACMFLFTALDRLRDFPSLAAAADGILANKSRFVPALVARATAMRMQQLYPEALADLTRAAQLEPGNAQVLNHLGIVQKEMGQLDLALQTFNRCLALKPDLSEAYWNRSDLLREPTDQQLAAMLDCLARPNLVGVQAARVHYALARAYEFRGDYARQFAQIEQGATRKRATLDYDHQAELALVRALPHAFNPALLQSTQQAQPAPATPIFICGLPRSGTTLVEQILSSHPEVTAGDELEALPQATAEFLRRQSIDAAFPAWAAALNDRHWADIGARYLGKTQDLHGTGYFTDKNLQNYKAVGLIHLALPEAKIVYCRREPMANLWGCYRQLFGDGMGFTYDLRELAQTYCAAETLLAYWQKVVGAKLLVVDYEDLVTDQLSVTRRILDFLGLSWNDACIDFHRNPRAVKTVSSVQVRQPMSSAGIAQWRRYAAQLQPLQEALEDCRAKPCQTVDH